MATAKAMTECEIMRTSEVAAEHPGFLVGATGIEPVTPPV